MFVLSLLWIIACGDEQNDPSPAMRRVVAPDGGAPSPTCCGCLCADARWSCSVDTCVLDGKVTKLAPEAGFFELAPGEAFPLSSNRRARMWYAFWPADSEPETRPLLLFFQGGPYAGMVILWGGNTGPFTIDPSRTGEQEIAPNPHSWTRFANVLYIDSPFAGFSYSMGEADDWRYGTPMQEAAAFVRVLLRFLKRHPQLERAPVVLVGESYGGVRASYMLRQLLRFGELSVPNDWYQDPELAQEIREHLLRTMAPADGSEITATQVAAQFGRQVLIQPRVTERTSLREVDCPLSEDQEGLCVRDEAADSEAQSLASAAEVRVRSMVSRVLKPSLLSTLAGVDVQSIRWLHASERVGAKGCALDSLRGWEAELVAVFGLLSINDNYYVLQSCRSEDESQRDAMNHPPQLTQTFADNLRQVETFMTYAALDRTVESRLVTGALSALVTVRSAEVRALSERIDQVRITFDDGLVRVIHRPRYASSGHPVALFEPERFAEDVRAWLAETTN